MKKIIIALALLFVALGAGWYFASPGYSMMQLRDAAVEGDTEALEERVDFPAVRQTLKDDLKTRLATEIGSDDEGALGSAFAMALIDPMIDGFITPEAVAGLVEKGEMLSPASGEAGGGDASGNAAEEEQAPEWVIEREGFSRFTARPKSRESGEVAPDAPGLIFERDGLGWRLVEIEIPEE
ncbi:DUF2939 domain-containing protein [Sphingomonadaceae bacterium]|nr:DUF2939 domain-containing protein [Sphingomonadaceae bacterium]